MAHSVISRERGRPMSLQKIGWKLVGGAVHWNVRELTSQWLMTWPSISVRLHMVEAHQCTSIINRYNKFVHFRTLTTNYNDGCVAMVSLFFMAISRLPARARLIIKCRCGCVVISCVQNISKSYWRILMTFCAEVRRGSKRNLLDFGGDPDFFVDP